MRLVDGVDGILFSEALAVGLEGIVSKRAGRFYKSGKSRNWLKAKNFELRENVII
jgi:ATP-dependent DNA ligase